MEVILNNTRLSIIQGDITNQATAAIVNAANPSLMGGGGVDGAIHRAGGSAILEECKQIVAKQGRLPPGKAVITTGGNLKAKYVIHTVGPVWHGGSRNEELCGERYQLCPRLETGQAHALPMQAQSNPDTIQCSEDLPGTFWGSHTTTLWKSRARTFLHWNKPEGYL